MVAIRKHRKIEWTVDGRGCHLCTSHAANFGGYPCMMVRYKRVRISRHVFQERYGTIPEGMIVRHKCDNPLCINPEHLILGTHQDNSNDCVDRGRTAKGLKNGRAKISESDAIEILQSDLSIEELAARFRVSRSAISLILRGKNWKHLQLIDQPGE